MDRSTKAKPRNRRVRDILLATLGFLSVIEIGEVREAHASSANFFETVGISTVAGTVLGASTLPFTDQPGKHTSNIAIGAAAGALVGVGILVYGLFSDDSDRDYGLSAPRNGVTPLYATKYASEYAPDSLLWMPVVSLNW